jgi:hypothetical protein
VAVAGKREEIVFINLITWGTYFFHQPNHLVDILEQENITQYILLKERIQSSTCQYAHTQSIHQQGMESWKLFISVIKVVSIQRPIVEKWIVQQQVKDPSKQ